MKYTISEQKQYLTDNLFVERLRCRESNSEDIKTFVQATRGEKLSRYLIENAWEDDFSLSNKVFLVRDKNTEEIAFYYALSCGILYTDYNELEKNLSTEEKELVDELVEAIRYSHKKNPTQKDLEAADIAYGEAIDSIRKKCKSIERVQILIELSEQIEQLKDEKADAFENSKEKNNVYPVKETFPAIDLKFFCRNGSYIPPIELDFKLGVFVFWELIVPHILKISDMIGCKYLYLFAADNTEIKEKLNDTINQFPSFDEEYSDELKKLENSDEQIARKLVSYYIKELKFQQISRFSILKPHFDRDCITLLQDISELPEKREAVWASHITDDYII